MDPRRDEFKTVEDREILDKSVRSEGDPETAPYSDDQAGTSRRWFLGLRITTPGTITAA